MRYEPQHFAAVVIALGFLRHPNLRLLKCLGGEFQEPVARAQQAVGELTLYYVDRGYINSGAAVPDQEVKDESLLSGSWKVD